MVLLRVSSGPCTDLGVLSLSVNALEKDHFAAVLVLFCQMH